MIYEGKAALCFVNFQIIPRSPKTYLFMKIINFFIYYFSNQYRLFLLDFLNFITLLLNLNISNSRSKKKTFWITFCIKSLLLCVQHTNKQLTKAYFSCVFVCMNTFRIVCVLSSKSDRLFTIYLWQLNENNSKVSSCICYFVCENEKNKRTEQQILCKTKALLSVVKSMVMILFSFHSMRINAGYLGWFSVLFKN